VSDAQQIDDMMRVGASAGLRPWEVYRMTQRELQTFLEGKSEEWDRVWELMAWVCANLINVHRGKKSAPIQPAKLLPKRIKNKQKNVEEEGPRSFLGMEPQEVARLFRERRLAREEKKWLNSPDAKRLHELQTKLLYGDAEPE
jgi:hypothetical protein